MKHLLRHCFWRLTLHYMTHIGSSHDMVAGLSFDANASSVKYALLLQVDGDLQPQVAEYSFQI